MFLPKRISPGSLLLPGELSTNVDVHYSRNFEKPELFNGRPGSYKGPILPPPNGVDAASYPSSTPRSCKMATLFLILLVFCTYMTLVASRPGFGEKIGLRMRVVAAAGVFGNGSKSWAQYTPYYAVEAYAAPPDECEITQVNILQRHGARYPTKSSTKAIETALAKVQAIPVSDYTDPQLEFIADFDYDLGEDDLVAYGAQESYDAGEEAFTRYVALVSADELPFVRASSKSRVVQSATNWTAGFAAASNGVYAPLLNVIISESGNDTLDDSDCPAAADTSDDAQTAAWIATYAPNITTILNAGAPGADLDDDDTQALISLCPFESVANEQRSEWCDLFEWVGDQIIGQGGESVWAGYEYWGDLDKYYNTGYGATLGPVQGVGWINELLARLTDTPVNDSTSTNTTLDSNPATFPLNRTIYADFTHDNLMIAVYSAMGLFAQPAPLDDTLPDPTRTWRASELVPFASRMVVERLSCGGEAYVRVLVNQAVQDLSFCGADGDGLCTLDAFVESQAYASSGGDGQWALCFE
ncbi:phosphoglycerate mutase-like protein [Laetiporus sulphureus 93-53]|uniref:Phytase A n=1 Tax=Laetiporus sulphureus 93-53 TaxID=1314785 RepID=A0A165E9N4_9APHY|nr:phosphoglycerate mutase-like protein [Laetiporus sulphureus 93-53]KZT06538.1 phosphoglycerate mutase-like protein [Laetiporus sulphureus 93-53]